jgi:hypothetical protein
MRGEAGMKVLIVAPVASWYGISHLPHALDRAGFTVGLAGARDGPLAHTRYVSRRWLVESAQNTSSKLIALVQNAFDQWSPRLIVPADDYAVGIFHRLVLRQSTATVSDGLRAALRTSMGSPRHYPTTGAKSRLAGAAAAASVDMAPQVAGPDAGRALAFARAHGFPVLIKPDAGWAGQGIRMCRTEADLLSGLKALRLSGKAGGGGPASYSVQKYIAGETAAIALAAYRGRMLDGIAYAKHRTMAARGPTAVARRLARPDMLEAGRRLVAHFRYTGFAGADFIIESGSGRAWLIEFNARPTPICGRAHLMGVDLAAALMAGLQGTAPPSAAPADAVELVAFFPQEWMRNPNSPFLHAARHDVPWSDPRLVRYFVERYAGARPGPSVRAMTTREGLPAPAGPVPMGIPGVDQTR